MPIAGVAWAQTIGIAAVEVQIDDGEWQPAELADAPSDGHLAPVAPAVGRHPGRQPSRVRATDADGAIQTDERAEPSPTAPPGITRSS